MSGDHHHHGHEVEVFTDDIVTPLSVRRNCPECARYLWVNEENFYRKTEGGFRTWCKECENIKRQERRRERKKGAPPKRYACTVCGDVRDVEWDETGGAAVCRTCAEVVRLVLAGEDDVTSTEMGLKRAEKFLGEVVDHNVWVEERKDAFRGDFFIPHPGRTWTRYPAWHHRDCVRLEESARRVIGYLESTADQATP